MLIATTNPVFRSRGVKALVVMAASRELKD
jgi:hypothetical protein